MCGNVPCTGLGEITMTPYTRQFKDEHEFEEWQDRVGPSLDEPYEESVSRCVCCNRFFDDHAGRYALCLTCETGGCGDDGAAPLCSRARALGVRHG